MTLTREQVMTRELQDTEARAALPPRETVLARRGMVASAHPFATQAGLEVLRHGGNAVEAAVAAAAVLMVVEPRNGHLGGDTFIQVDLPSEGRVVALNGSGAAPAAATLERYQRLGGIPEEGLLSSTVPGTVSCWGLALERFGSRPLAELLEAAIAYAEEGIPVTVRLHRLLGLDAPTYRKYPETARVFLPDGRVPQVGELLRQPDLAESLRRIGTGGPDEFYRGALAEEMVAFSEQHGGLFSREDFADHRTEVLEPLVADYRGYRVYEQPPVSQGIVVLLALKILEQLDLPRMEPGSVEVIHLLIEATKLAFEDRLRHLGDPWFCDVPIAELLSEAHARDQARRIDPRRARPAAMPRQRQPDTTYMCLADGDGTLVSYVHSLFSGAGVVMGKTGALMNSRMLGFDLEAGHPNCLAPGKRPVHTLNTYVVRKPGAWDLVGGTPGAHWQVQTNLQILTNLLDFGMDLPNAIEAPRFTIGDQLVAGDPTIKLESRAGDRVIEELRELGHPIEVIGPWDSGGAVQLIQRDLASGVCRGATEIRRAGSSVSGI